MEGPSVGRDEIARWCSEWLGKGPARYPDAEAHAEEQGWKIHRFDGDHLLILVAPDEVAAALVQITSEES